LGMSVVFKSEAEKRVGRTGTDMSGEFLWIVDDDWREKTKEWIPTLNRRDKSEKEKKGGSNNG